MVTFEASSGTSACNTMVTLNLPMCPDLFSIKFCSQIIHFDVNEGFAPSLPFVQVPRGVF